MPASLRRFIHRFPRKVLSAAVLAASLGVMSPATAEVRLGGDPGGYYTVPVMTWWDIPFRSVIRQRYDFSCGSAAVATLLTYHYGQRINERQTFAAMWEKGEQAEIRRFGFSMFDMKSYLNAIGYRAEGFRMSIEQLRQTKRPLIAMVTIRGYKHFVVVKGVRDDTVLTGDPALGLNQYTLADFGEAWNGIALVILETPDKVQPSFNLAGDWGPWARAPIEEQSGLHAGVGDLTTFLPPAYQITPQILLDVRVGTVN